MSQAADLLPPLPELYAGKRVLLTGATGFLGKVFLSALLRHCPDVGKVIVLLRAEGEQGAQDRFLRDVIASPALDPLREKHGMGLREFVLGRVEVLPADLAEKDAGLSPEQLERATRDLDLVMHVAGLVDFVPPLDEAVSTNVDGTLTALELAKRAGPGRCHFVHVSTCFVCGLRPGQHPEELDLRDYPAREDVSFTGFDAEKELEVVRRLIERIRTEEVSDPAVLADMWEEAEGSPRKAKRLVDVRTRRRLIEAGVERARRWGWPNTYTYSKALAERLVELRKGEVASAVLVRPAVVESALSYPFPGWNQGINTSAPLVWMTSQGHRYWPTHTDLSLDVVPVDSVVHALVAVGGAALAGQADEVYQLGSSDVNPLAMRRVVELASLAYREHDQKRVGVVRAFLRRHFEGVDVSLETYQRFGVPPKAALARRLSAWLEKVPQPDERPRLAALLDKVKQTVKSTTRDLERAEQVIEIFLPFIATCPVVFRTDRTRRLFARLQPADRERLPYAPPTLDWRHYWKDVHVPGLERWAFPQLRLAQGASPGEFERQFSTLTALIEDRVRFGKLSMWRRLDGQGQIVQRVTYEEGLSRAQAAARRLIKDGVRPGDRVVLWSENAPEWGLGYFAILLAGGTAVPLEPDTEPQRVLALASAARAGRILVSASCRKKGGQELARLMAAAPGDPPRQVELEALVAPRDKKEALPPLPQEQELVPRAPASLIYTSGTTGAPKGVLLSHQAFCEQVRALASLYAVGSDDRILSVLPLHHCFEFSAGFLLPLYGGASVTYLDETSAEAVRRGLEAVKPTAMIGVPALFEAWYRRIRRQVKARGPNAERAYEGLLAFHREFRARTGLNLGARLFAEVHQGFGGALRFVVSGGSALPRDIALEFHGLGIELYEGYGLTEAAPVLCAHRPGEERSPGSVGPPIPGAEVRIREPDGEGVGELLGRSPSLFLGYDRDPEQTARTLVDGWLHTGDLGRIDERGQVHVVGRIKDAIVDASGNTVHPDEVEDLYLGCEDVAELAVAGVANKGEQHDVVGALVVPKTDTEGGVDAARERIREFVRARAEALPYPKRIKVLQFTSRALPRTPTRKVKRAEVARLLAEAARERPGASRRARRGATAGPARVAQLFEEVAGVEAARVVPEASLSQDLGLDSIALAEVALAIGDELGRPAPKNLAGVATVQDLLRLFEADAIAPQAVQVQEAEPRAIPLPSPVRAGVGKFLDGLHWLGYGRILDCTVLGRGNIPHHTNVIVVANHQSHLDVGLVKHALGDYGRDLVSAGARDYFFSNTFKATYFENFTQVVPFDRAASVRESLERFVELLRQGRSILIFPEGTRSVTGRMASFKPGLGLVVQASRTGILPVYLHGTHQSMPKGTWLPRREPLEARIGPYLPPDKLLGLTAHLGRRQQANAIVAAVRAALVALRDKAPFDLEAELRRAGQGDGGEPEDASAPADTSAPAAPLLPAAPSSHAAPSAEAAAPPRRTRKRTEDRPARRRAAAPTPEEGEEEAG